jgi:hypothetical protein
MQQQQQRDGSAPPTTLQEQPKESTPLLSNQRRRHMRDGSDSTDATSNANGSSWSSVGASMRFRNPLQSRRSATPVSYNGSGSGSGSGNYAASAVASTVHTDATASTLTSRFKWRPGGDLTAHADNNDDDAQSWTAGSVVKEFVRPLWNRDREDNHDGIGRSASFAYALRTDRNLEPALALALQSYAVCTLARWCYLICIIFTSTGPRGLTGLQRGYPLMALWRTHSLDRRPQRSRTLVLCQEYDCYCRVRCGGYLRP